MSDPEEQQAAWERWAQRMRAWHPNVSTVTPPLPDWWTRQGRSLDAYLAECSRVGWPDER